MRDRMTVLDYQSVWDTGIDTAFLRVDIAGEEFGIWLGPGFASEPENDPALWGGVVLIEDEAERNWWEVLVTAAKDDRVSLPERMLSTWPLPPWDCKQAVVNSAWRVMNIYRHGHVATLMMTDLLEEVGLTISL